MGAEEGRVSGVLLVMGVTGPAFVLVLSVLFHLNDDPMPAELAMLVVPAGLVFAICLPLLLQRIDLSGTALQPGLWAREREWRRKDRERQEQECQRIERLGRDPATAEFAVALRRGEYWSDEAIAYARDPSLLVTDAAIRPIERAMRDAGIPLRRGLGATLTAHCRIDPQRLYAQFPPDGRYCYTDDFHFDRPCDPAETVVISTAGTSYIHIVRTGAIENFPVFPTITKP